MVRNCVSVLEELRGSLITEDVITDYREAVKRKFAQHPAVCAD